MRFYFNQKQIATVSATASVATASQSDKCSLSFCFTLNAFRGYLFLPLLYSRRAKNRSLLYLRARKATTKPLKESLARSKHLCYVTSM